MDNPQTAVRNATIAVVAHTKRAEQAHELMESVGAAYMTVDDGTLGCEGNHRKAWDWLNRYAQTEWCVVLEDDAQPVPNFSHQLAQALTYAPTPIVSLYLGRKRPPHWQSAIQHATQKAEHKNASYITAHQLLHAVGVAIHIDLVADMLHNTRNSIRPWDYTVGAYAQHIEEPITYLWPSLVDHADQDTVTKHQDRAPRTPGRTAWKTGSRDVWNPILVEMHQ